MGVETQAMAVAMTPQTSMMRISVLRVPIFSSSRLLGTSNRK
jgi:hypothetical protein